MPKPCSYDLRTKVIEAIELDGLKKSDVSELFHLSRNTINLWLRRKQETGDYQAQKTTPLKSNQKIKDWQLFREFVIEVDKKLLREQIKNGIDVSKWCSLGERSNYLSIR